MDIKESDWRVFRKVRGPALDRYCQHLIKEVRQVIDNDRNSYHERYLKLWKLLRKRDKTLGPGL